ncbi:hypothetical protein CkaCkLH20_07407 [Colletotrichum karsti]|uniref:Uncharacterized protein n=1 Tax=Colletotrichum karsti TaxID=1095194 RepID=A0A9P6I506_9PEZI|nr:uncharacterized protein CkaCkLH20_07407 [Colletotrichum karsti]KAF9875141.1 hypothetical protein CkaCkLH20_07407 [Colletotrichum karsti]
MPPIRTPKTTPSKAGGSLAAFGFVPVAKEEALTRAANHIPTAPVVPVKVVPVKVSKGLNTNKIVFSSFVLTPEHIDALITYSTTCKTLKHFEFLYTDVSYDAKNDAKALTDACILKLARAYPTLQTVKLPGTSDLTDAAVLALCEHCPDLATLEITKAVAGSNAIGVGAFEGMLLNGDWAPGLKNITVCDVTWGTTKFMAKMREMSRSRPQLVVHLASISEEKKWGDWDIEEGEEAEAAEAGGEAAVVVGGEDGEEEGEEDGDGHSIAHISTMYLVFTSEFPAAIIIRFKFTNTRR